MKRIEEVKFTDTLGQEYGKDLLELVNAVDGAIGQLDVICGSEKWCGDEELMNKLTDVRSALLNALPSTKTEKMLRGKKLDENTKVTLTIGQLKKLIKESTGDNSVSTDDVNELVLYITNDSDLYHHYVEPIIANQRRKYRKGIYNPDLAVILWRKLADEGTRKYDREINDGHGSITWLNSATRNAIAAELRDHYMDRIINKDQ